MKKYTLLIYETEPDETGYWAQVAELSGCFTSGETLDELVANAQEAIELWIAMAREKNASVPQPSEQLTTPSSDQLSDGPLLGIIGVAPRLVAV